MNLGRTQRQHASSLIILRPPALNCNTAMAVRVIAMAALLAVLLGTSSAIAPAAAGGLGVDVNTTTGAYRIVLDGQTFLRSGQLLFHANGEWHSTAEQDGREPTCGPAQKGTDQTGGTMMQRIDRKQL